MAVGHGPFGVHLDAAVVVGDVGVAVAVGDAAVAVAVGDAAVVEVVEDADAAAVVALDVAEDVDEGVDAASYDEDCF